MSNTETLAQEMSKAYQREWRTKNKEKVREYNKRYWQKRAEKLQKGCKNNEQTPHLHN